MAKNPVNKLSVDVRTTTGKGASRARRGDGSRGPLRPRQRPPAPRTQRARLRRRPAQVGHQRRADLDIEGTEQLALTKAIEIHPIRRNIQHADLLVVRRGEKVVVEVNVHLEGDAASGTLVTQDATTIEIEAEALSIPQQLTVSVEGAEEGTQITAGQVELPAGVTLISDPEMLVVNIVTAPTAEDLEPRVAARRPPRGRRGDRGRRGHGAPRASRPRPSKRLAVAEPLLVVGLGNPDRSTPKPGTTWVSWSPTSWRRGWARRSRCTSAPAPRSPPAASPTGRWCWPSRART
jgi:large subunit ribosomal protein L25